MRLSNILKLHLTVFIWGFTAILGALISLEALPLVWYRLVLASLALGLFLYWKKGLSSLSASSMFRLLGIGLLVAAHWVCFYHSLKVSTVAVTLVCLSSQTFFTGLLEPLFNRRKVSGVDLFISVLVVAGIFLIFHFETRYVEGIVYGLLAALLSSLFTVLNAWEIRRHDGILIGFYEMLGGLAGLSLFLLATGAFFGAEMYALRPSDFIYLFVLGTICTAFAYVWGVQVMQELSAYTVVLITNLEPVYGILLAFIFFGDNERMTGGFYLGALVIIGAIFLHPLLKRQSLVRAG